MSNVKFSDKVVIVHLTLKCFTSNAACHIDGLIIRDDDLVTDKLTFIVPIVYGKDVLLTIVYQRVYLFYVSSR